jgi:phosphatidylserine decarboxylase
MVVPLMRVAREGMAFVVPAASAAAGLLIFGVTLSADWVLVLAGLATAVAVMTLWFFRDPFRECPNPPEGALLSPADGVVVAIVEDHEREFLGESALRVSIFLSIFDVHINRIPVAGTVKYVHHTLGRFLAAYDERASAENERTVVGVETDAGFRLVVRQVAGLIARRIVCRAAPGMHYSTGERFGLIRFGSRTDLFVPPDTVVDVKVGDRVYGGKTVIGRRP